MKEVQALEFESFGIVWGEKVFSGIFERLFYLFYFKRRIFNKKSL